MLFERGSMVQFVLECMLRLEPGRMLRYEPNRILIFEQGSLVRLEKCLIVALVIHRMLRFQQCLIFLFNPARSVHSSQFVWYDSNRAKLLLFEFSAIQPITHSAIQTMQDGGIRILIGTLSSLSLNRRLTIFIFLCRFFSFFVLKQHFYFILLFFSRCLSPIFPQHTIRVAYTEKKT